MNSIKDINISSDGCLNILPNNRLKTLYNSIKHMEDKEPDEEGFKMNCRYFQVDEIKKITQKW